MHMPSCFRIGQCGPIWPVQSAFLPCQDLSNLLKLWECVTVLVKLWECVIVLVKLWECVIFLVKLWECSTFLVKLWGYIILLVKSWKCIIFLVKLWESVIVLVKLWAGEIKVDFKERLVWASVTFCRLPALNIASKKSSTLDANDP